MKFKKYIYKCGRPMWKGGGFDLKTGYKLEQTETHHGLECKVFYYSNDGENINRIELNVPAIYRKETLSPNDNIPNVVKNLFLEYIAKPDENYKEHYDKAKEKYDDLIDLFCVSIDFGQKCERYFSAMIYKEFKKIIA